MVGSATPSINNGCPPKIEWMIPQIEVEANVSTALRAPPFNTLLNRNHRGQFLGYIRQ